MSPRPGFVLDVDRSTPSDLVLARRGLPPREPPRRAAGSSTRPSPLDALADPVSAIRHALEQPVGDSEPLCPQLLARGWRSPSPSTTCRCRSPRCNVPTCASSSSSRCSTWRPRPVWTTWCSIAALALHRRMTEAELRHALGDRIYDAFAPHGLLTQHDAEDPDKLIHLGLTEQGEDVEINKRAATSDLLVYVNINLVAMDGGHKSVATGLASYRSLRHHHNARTMPEPRRFMDQHRSELHSSNWRMGRLIAASGVKIFQIETTLNTDTFPEQFRFLQRREWEWTRTRPGRVPGHVQSARRPLPSASARSIFHSIRAPHKMTSVQAGEVEAVHARTTENVYAQQLRRRRGPDRHPHHGTALHLPVQRQLDHEPDPGGVPRARVLLQPLPGAAPRARRRRGHH